MLGESGVRTDREHPGRQRQRRVLERGSAKAGSTLGKAARGRKGALQDGAPSSVEPGQHGEGQAGQQEREPLTGREADGAGTCPISATHRSPLWPDRTYLPCRPRRAQQGKAGLGTAPGRGRPAAPPSMVPSCFPSFPPSFPSARAPLASARWYLSCGAAIARSLRCGSGRRAQVGAGGSTAIRAAGTRDGGTRECRDNPGGVESAPRTGACCGGR